MCACCWFNKKREFSGLGLFFRALFFEFSFFGVSVEQEVGDVFWIFFFLFCLFWLVGKVF